MHRKEVTGLTWMVDDEMLDNVISGSTGMRLGRDVPSYQLELGVTLHLSWNPPDVE